MVKILVPRRPPGFMDPLSEPSRPDESPRQPPTADGEGHRRDVIEAAGSRKPRRRLRGSLTEVSVLVLTALLLALTLKSYVAEAYEIKGRSMMPTFHNGERVVVLKAFFEVSRGDIIIFSSTEDPTKDLIKRVVGLPGEVIRIDAEGHLYVDEQLIIEDYIPEENLYSTALSRPFSYRVKPGEYFVLGDNRRDSHDSRRFHGVPLRNVKGKVVVRWWPLDEVRSF